MDLRVKARSLVINLLLTAALAAAGPLPAFAVEKHQFDVPAEEAPAAIRDFASQAHVQILVAGENVKDKHLRAVSGEFSTDQGLQLLLAGSGLSPQYVGDRSIALVTAADSNAPSQSNAKEASKSTADHFRVAQVDQGTPAGAAPGAGPTSTPPAQFAGPVVLEEVIVTAQKRNERLMDVPVPVTVLDAETLVAQNEVRLQDYYNTVPGLSLVTDSHGLMNLSIRGITTGAYTNPTVGIIVDDAPFGSTTSIGVHTSAPDLDPADLARVEVLRGPQGTLYGASSIGGLIKFVTIDPSTDALSGHIQVGASGVQNGTDAGYNVRGSVNVPITDTLAIRASGFARRDPGYVDNAALNLDGVNREDVSGGRLSALWRPSDAFSLKLSALLQNTQANGTPDVTLQSGLGELQQVQPLPLGGFYHRMQSYTATLTAALGGGITLTSISGYGLDQYHDTRDLSALYGAYGAPPNSVSLYGAPVASYVSHSPLYKFTQEMRLSGSIQQRADWLAGVFYTHENLPNHDQYYALNVPTGSVAGFLFDDSYPTSYTEYAFFADVTLHVTDRFDVQVGGRESQNRQDYVETITGPLWEAYGLPPGNPPVQTKDNAFTYLVTPSFKFSPDLMVYARFASGYRPGGPNTTCILFSVPCHYQPDKTLNYEAGVKGDVLAQRLSFDASVYYIDWKDIQLQVVDPTTFAQYYTNGSRAKSQGVELSVQARPLQGLTVSAWVAFNDAKLVDALPDVSPASPVGAAGDRLPYSSRFSGNLSIEERFPLSSRVTGFVGAAVSAVGDRKDVFTNAFVPTRNDLPAYTVGSLRAGTEYESWEATLFANNITDQRGILAYPVPSANPSPIVNYIQPRTVGLNLSKKF